MNNKKIPFVSIYLDSNLLIDVIASIDNGFRVMEEVKTVNQTDTENKLDGSLQAGFSFPSVFNLFKVGTEAKIGASSNVAQGSSTESAHVRYHTLGSLLYNLITNLQERKLITSVENKEDFTKVKCGDLITATGIVNLNPLNNSLEKTIRFIDGVELLSSFGELGSNYNKAQMKQKTHSMKQIKSKLKELLDDITSKGQNSLIIQNKALDYSILFSIYDNFTRDIAGIEFGSHTLTVFGKVINVSENGANLMERSSLSAFNENLFDVFTNAFKELEEKFNIPKFTVKVEGKVLTIIPIAIYS